MNDLNRPTLASTYDVAKLRLSTALKRLLPLALILATSGALEFPADAAAEASPGAEARPTRRWGEDYFPDVYLTTHEGKRVHFYRDLVQGKVVAINFMFTSCENVCPAETARLKQVHGLLGDRVGQDIHMYSITIDPEVDTPEVLSKYRDRFGAGEGWTFLTAPRETTDLIQKKLGLLVDKLDDPKDHNASLVLGNERTGRWIRRSPYDNPQRLAHLLAESMHNWTRPPREDRMLASYSAAPSRSNWETGERIFRTRCAACHSIGGGSGLGPDLAGVVERRDPEWLVRWIAEPDALIAEGDPIAVALLREWNDIRMPNLALDEKETRSVIEFMRAQDAVAREAHSEAPPGEQSNQMSHGDHSGRGQHGAGHGEAHGSGHRHH